MRKNVLITGASSGLGLGMAREFARRGANLALCARRLDELQSLRAELEARHPGCVVRVRALDVNDHEQVFTTFRAFRDDLGRLDRVVVNAGMGKGASLGTGYFHANLRTAETNFVAAIAQCEAALEIFRAQDAGHLVTISSVAATRGMLMSLFLLPFALLCWPAGRLADRVGWYGPIVSANILFGITYASYGLLPFSLLPVAMVWLCGGVVMDPGHPCRYDPKNLGKGDHAYPYKLYVWAYDAEDL